MKAKPPSKLDRAMARARSESKRALELASDDKRVCGPQCAAACPVCGTTDCKCMCNRKCAEMPKALTSDEEGYPLEKGIAPLVFEMKRLGCFEPCWSSEGHLNKGDDVWTTPQIWFYADSMTSIRVLSDALSELHASGETMFDWEIALTQSTEETPTPTFALRPAGVTTSPRALSQLQKDIAAMAEVISVRFMKKLKKVNQDALEFTDQPIEDWHHVSRPRSN